MTLRVGALVGVAALAGLGACTPRPPIPAAADIQAARQAAQAVEIRFRTEILERLEREDASAVFMAYRDHAAEYVRESSAKSHLDIRRVGLRVRNPANAADDWEAEQLEKFDFLVNAGYDINVLEASAVVTENKQKWFRWIKPVGVAEACMVCHGDGVPAEILAQLRQDYPQDNATGYLPSEMLGAYSVRRRLDETQR
jgi:hypothetical protein